MTQYAIGAWTRVGERLPEYGVQVLAWTGDGGYPVIAYLRRDEHGDFWEGFHNGEEIDPACVTLWTPMPSPPPFEQNTRDQQNECVAVEDAFARSNVRPTWPDDEPANIGPMAAAMADEITRLRAEVERLSSPAPWQDECCAVEAAFARSGVRAKWPDDEPGNIGPMAHAMADEITRLRAEVERLGGER